MPSNLQSDITEVRARLGEPYRTDETDSFFLDSEIIDWIYYGELRTWTDLPANVIAANSEGLVASASFACSGSTIVSYSEDGFEVPAALTGITYKVNSVSVFNAGSIRAQGRPVSLDVFSSIVSRRSTNYANSISVGGSVPSIRRFYYHETDSGLILSTAGDTSDTINVEYVKAPTRRYKHLRDTSQATSNATTVTMSTSASATFNVANFFQSCGLKIVSGIGAGVITTVTSHTAATPNVITIPSIGFLPGNVFLYEMGENGSFNDTIREPSILHACYLAALKDESPDRANAFLAQYERCISSLKGQQ